MSKKWTGTPALSDKEYEKLSSVADIGTFSGASQLASELKADDKKHSRARQAKINKDRKARIAKAKARKNSK